MPPYLRTALCPVAAPSGTGAAPAPYLRPRPDKGPALSLTVPCVPRSAGIVRATISCALRAHGLDRFGPPATLAVTELTATATRLDAQDDLYLSLRHRDDVLRLVVWDQHPRHSDPDAVAVCEERRRRSLWLLAAVVDDWGGEWGGR
ncbi:ATP-binding protein [Streptomyces sp. H27-C3]|uniref:ATP-binding protein n=1 Tax=Streptomyces sp. H27-C3 TaxID=3046305 RepID=UPI0024BAA8A3|nr:ATP-binding protein [Streptomyces sp. H27-C3]MDJ0466544.1 ATP-binding protein [Streptomyces sp. H27-C3]